MHTLHIIWYPSLSRHTLHTLITFHHYNAIQSPFFVSIEGGRTSSCRRSSSSLALRRASWLCTSNQTHGASNSYDHQTISNGDSTVTIEQHSQQTEQRVRTNTARHHKYKYMKPQGARQWLVLLSLDFSSTLVALVGRQTYGN